ncbi:MAG: hypothetical protein HY018_04695 [Hydrogenophilales bacterium]|nr:hypothetical protein [Hydrogenophilales bacterium]
MTDQTGIVYVATRKEHYVAEAFLSAHSAKDLMPNLPITLFTDLVDSVFCKGHCFDKVVSITTQTNYRSRWADGQLDRIKCLIESPYERTLHIDTDTRIQTMEVIGLYKKLDTIDIAMAECQMDASVSASHYGHPMFNVGVILYKKSANVVRLFDEWKTLTTSHFDLANLDEVPPVDCLPNIDDQELRRELLFMDQLSMVQLLSPEVNKLGLNFEILPESWNYRGSGKDRVFKQPIKINHHPSLRSQLGQDIIDRAARYQKSGHIEFSRKLLMALMDNAPNPNARAYISSLLQKNHISGRGQ